MTDTTQPGGTPASADTTPQATTAPEAVTPVEPADAATAAPSDDPAASHDEPGNDTADDGKPKKKTGGFQKRIDELTRSNYQERIRRETLERELAELKKAANPTDPGDEPTIDQFTTVDDFVKAHKAWGRRSGHQEGYKQAQDELAQDRQKTEAIELQAAFQTRVDTTKGKYADFNQVIAPIAPIVGENNALTEYMVRSDLGPEMFYHLGKNPGVLLDLVKLDTFSALRELTRLEARLTAPPPPKPVTNAPAPIKPVGARESVPVTLGDLAKSDDASAYIAKANRRGKP